MYLNNLSYKNLHIIQENIFSLKSWSKEHQQELKKTITFLKSESKKVIDDSINYYKNNYKDEYKELKKANLKPVYIVNSAEDLKEIIERIHNNFENDPVFSDPSIVKNYKSIFNYLNDSPKTVMLKITSSDNKAIPIGLIFVPEISFFDRFLSKGKTLTKWSDHRLWIEIDRALSLYHECREFSEFAKKRFHGGQIYIKASDSNFYIVGNHYSVYVLAYEAILLNKYKDVQALKYIRNYRKKFEWKIIKDNTGVDFETLTKITPDIIKKLDELKKHKIKNDYLLYSNINDLDFSDTSTRNKNKNNKMPDVVKKFLKSGDYFKK